MRVLRHGKESLDIELSDAAYRICGGFGSGTNSSVFLAEEIYKIVEEYQLGRDAGAVTVGIASWELQKKPGLNPRKLQKLQKAGARYIAADFLPLIRCWNEEESI